MTTILIDKRIGLIITDSRVTQFENKSFLGIRFRKDVRHYVAPQKALYVHDRLFLACGNVDQGIDVLLNSLINKQDIFKARFKKGSEFNAFLIDKCWMVIFRCRGGKLSKKTVFLGKHTRFSAGSGGRYLTECFEMKNTDPHHALRVFSRVKNFDKATDDNMNIYRF